MNSFLQALKARCTVYELNGGRDWRLGRGDEETDGEKALEATNKGRTWFGWGEEERVAFEQAVQAVTQGREGEIGSFPLSCDVSHSQLVHFRCSDICQRLWTKSQSPLGSGQSRSIHVRRPVRAGLGNCGLYHAGF
jgi:hypothetical protein